MEIYRIHGMASRAILFTVIAALAAGLGLLAAEHFFTGPRSSTTAAPANLKTVRFLQPARELASYRLTLSDGSVLTPERLQGHWTVVFLGFTHCPDVCPTTLAELAKAQSDWNAMPEKIRPRVLFVSVDAGRDTPAIVGNYAHYFNPHTWAATGNDKELGDFAKALGLVFMKVPMTGNDYSMDHSATLVVLDPTGRQAGLIRPPFAAKDISADLRLLAETRP